MVPRICLYVCKIAMVFPRSYAFYPLHFSRERRDGHRTGAQLCGENGALLKVIRIRGTEPPGKNQTLCIERCLLAGVIF